MAYNVELFGGRFHSTSGSRSPGARFPSWPLRRRGRNRPPGGLLAAAFAAFLSLAQRHLSTQVRTVRRRTDRVSGTISFTDGSEEPITQETLLRAPEAALQALTWAIVALALALLVFRLA